MNEMLENWVNGNCQDVVKALIAGKMSEAIEFALLLDKGERRKLVKMLQNRDQ